MFDSTILIWSLIFAAIFWCVVLWVFRKGFNHKFLVLVFVYLYFEHSIISIPIRWLTGGTFENGSSGVFNFFSVNKLGMVITLFLNLFLTVFIVYWILYLTIKP